MNILLLCGNISYAGAQRQLLELAQGLTQRHKVIVCSISSKTPLLEEFKIKNIEVEILGLKMRNLSRIISSLSDIIRKHDISIIYSFLKTANTYSRIMKMFFPKIKVVSSERSSDTIISFLDKITEKLLSNMTDLYITNSFAGKDALKKNYNVDKVKVIHNGIDETRFEFLKKSSLNEKIENKIIISLIGRIKPDKNYEMFLEVAEKVCEKHNNALFFAIGDQPNSNDLYQNKIIEKKNNLKHADRILFVGKRSDIPEILFETNISILTSHREGCSNTVLESMFAKCPVVVTDVGDNRIMLSELNQNFIVSPDDTEGMVKKISILINDSKLRNEIGIDNYNKARKEFTKEIMVKNTESVLLELLHTVGT